MKKRKTLLLFILILLPISAAIVFSIFVPVMHEGSMIITFNCCLSAYGSVDYSLTAYYFGFGAVYIPGHFCQGYYWNIPYPPAVRCSIRSA